MKKKINSEEDLLEASEKLAKILDEYEFHDAAALLSSTLLSGLKKAGYSNKEIEDFYHLQIKSSNEYEKEEEL